MADPNVPGPKPIQKAITEISQLDDLARPGEPETDARWKIIESLIPGGQGETFAVTDLKGQFPGTLVMKRLRSDKEQARKRFAAEIEAIGRLEHPGIIKIVHSGVTEKKAKPFYVMPRMTNGALQSFVLRFRGDLVKTLECFAAICRAVAAAHDAKVIHRDLKPQNILLDENWNPVVADFGICFNLLDAADRFTEIDERVGPALFMAPELENGQLRAEDITAATDIYSLGKLLWYMLYPGEKPFVFAREAWNETRFNLVALRDDPMLRYLNELVFPKTIVHSPNERFKDVAALISAIEEIKRLIADDFEPLAATGMRCKFCGRGHYTCPVDLPAGGGGAGPNALQNFGFTRVGDSRWRILVCSECGHCQIFRFDHRYSPGSPVW